MAQRTEPGPRPLDGPGPLLLGPVSALLSDRGPGSLAAVGEGWACSLSARPWRGAMFLILRARARTQMLAWLWTPGRGNDERGCGPAQPERESVPAADLEGDQEEAAWTGQPDPRKDRQTHMHGV